MARSRRTKKSSYFARRRKTRTKIETRVYARNQFLGFRKRNRAAKKKIFLKRRRRFNRLLLLTKGKENYFTRKKIDSYLPSPTLTSKLRICTNRKIRREVIHAKKHNGKVGQKKPNYIYPNIRCGR